VVEREARLKPDRRQTAPKFAERIDRITGEDRRSFEEHPEATFRTRPAAEKEFWPVHDSTCVLSAIVTQVRPEIRLRAPVVRVHLPESVQVQ
jgi:hypothetical protein